MKAFCLKRVQYVLSIPELNLVSILLQNATASRVVNSGVVRLCFQTSLLFMFTSLAWEQSQGPMMTIVPGFEGQFAWLNLL